MSYRPTIVAFLCNWCAYTGADLAGTSRLRYAPNIRIIRIMCSGRIEPTFILKAFKEGADGVLVCGCNLGDCHYIDGNYKTLQRITLLRKLLDQLGFEEPRVRLRWVCASCAEDFVSAVEEITAELKALGPLNQESKLAQAATEADLVTSH